VLRENRAMLALTKTLGFESQADENQPSEIVRVSREVTQAA
jgi:hypothetical protein